MQYIKYITSRKTQVQQLNILIYHNLCHAHEIINYIVYTFLAHFNTISVLFEIGNYQKADNKDIDEVDLIDFLRR